MTGNPRAKRALDQFNRYLEFVSRDGSFDLWEEESIWYAVQYSIEDVKSHDRVDEWFCNALKEKFSEWRKREISEAQSAESKKIYKKRLRSKLMVENIRAGWSENQADGRKI